jgi:hypothetical protein
MPRSYKLQGARAALPLPEGERGGERGEEKAGERGEEKGGEKAGERPE